LLLDGGGSFFFLVEKRIRMEKIGTSRVRRMRRRGECRRAKNEETSMST
jgi:hypothetical protein